MATTVTTVKPPKASALRMYMTRSRTGKVRPAPPRSRRLQSPARDVVGAEPLSGTPGNPIIPSSEFSVCWTICQPW